MVSNQFKNINIEETIIEMKSCKKCHRRYTD